MPWTSRALPRPHRAGRRARSSFVIGLAALLVLTGCGGATSAATARGSAAASGSPTPRVTMTPTLDAAETRLASLSLEQRVASLLMLHTPGTDGLAQRAFVDRFQLGGLILMGSNIPGGTQATDTVALTALTSTIRGDDAFPPLIGIDQEGGDVSRISTDTSAGADQLRNLPPAATVDSFRARSELLQSVGIPLNFGIVADISADPSSFIYSRSFGADAASSSARVASAVVGEGSRVFSTLKHFPGHGAAPGDSHFGVPQTSMSLAEWRASDAAPFRAGIDAGAEFVMFGHLAYTAVDALPASLSPEWHRILRKEMGFHGLIISDDMRMLYDSGDARYADPLANVISAFAAGTSIVLYTLPADPSTVGVDIDALIVGVADAVRDGRISAEQIDSDALAVLRLRETLADAE